MEFQEFQNSSNRCHYSLDQDLASFRTVQQEQTSSFLVDKVQDEIQRQALPTLLTAANKIKTKVNATNENNLTLELKITGHVIEAKRNVR